MKTFITFAAIMIACTAASSAKEITLNDIAAHLSQDSGYKSSLRYEVLLPP